MRGFFACCCAANMADSQFVLLRRGWVFDDPDDRDSLPLYSAYASDDEVANVEAGAPAVT